MEAQQYFSHSKEHYTKSTQDHAHVPQKYFQLLMSPELWWNHSQQDIWEQNLQSVVNGEKLTSTASNKLYRTHISECEVAWTKINIQKSHGLPLTLLSQKTLPFLFNTGMGAWIHNFYVLPKHTHKILFWLSLCYWGGLVGCLDWVESFALNLTNEKRSGNLPSCLSQREKKQAVMKSIACFCCQIYVTTSQGILSSSKILKLYHQDFETVKSTSIQWCLQ